MTRSSAAAAGHDSPEAWVSRWLRRGPDAVNDRCTDACKEGIRLFPALVRVVGLVSDARRDEGRRFLGTHAWLEAADGGRFDPTARQYERDGVPPEALGYHAFLPGVTIDQRERPGFSRICGICGNPVLLVNETRICFCTHSRARWLSIAVGWPWKDQGIRSAVAIARAAPCGGRPWPACRCAEPHATILGDSILNPDGCIYGGALCGVCRDGGFLSCYSAAVALPLETTMERS